MTCSTTDGRFTGIEKDGVRFFQGITYARYERFSDAVMEVASEGPVDATQFGVLCPQRSSRLASTIGEESGSTCEEGRLCLAVCAPAGAEKLPVMVWVHGGAFLTGGSEEKRYSTERLVRTGNVIVVKISYRLGAEGYLRTPDGVCHNFGLGDQKLALEWIRQNISAFGGDPEDITVFGQSAGAYSIAAMISTATSPLPFRKAILQSPPLGISMTEAEAEEIAFEFNRRLGKPAAEADIEEILDAQDAVKGMKTGMTFMPLVKDIMAIPECVRKSDLSVVIGWTSHEVTPFIRKTLGRHLASPGGRLITKIATRRLFIRPSQQYVRKLRKAGIAVSTYSISWYPEGNPLGACHCIELPFLLGEYRDWTEADMTQGMKKEEFDAFSKEFLSSWTTFAVTGIFNTPSARR